MSGIESDDNRRVEGESARRLRDEFFEVQRWLSWLEPKIDAILALEEGWGGSNSHPVEVQTLTKLLDALAVCNIPDDLPPQLVPLRSGGVQAEWHVDGLSLEIGINRDGGLFALSVNGGNCRLVIDDASSFDDTTTRTIEATLWSLRSD